MTAADLGKFLTAIENAQRRCRADRAAVVTGAILQIVRHALLAWIDHDGGARLAAARVEIEELLREEFADIACTAVSEIRPEDG